MHNTRRSFGGPIIRALNATIFAVLASVTAPSRAPAQTSARAVLVTGAGSGIGRAVAERLAVSGFFVYAGARSPQEMAELNAIANVQAVRLDVTSATDIAGAVETVTKGGRGLYGVVRYRLQ